MKILSNGSVTSARGFKANGIAAGIKRSGKHDLSLIYSQIPCATAAVYTKNSVKAAPLLVCAKNLKNKISQAIIANSGNANCFTGEFGYRYAEQTTEELAKILGIKASNVLVASTGIIGKPLPFEKIKEGIPQLVSGLSEDGGHDAAKGIMTTDLTAKEIAVEITLGGKKVVIGGCAKGSGMIQPDMATMLCFITTDAAISTAMLQKALSLANEISFNCITVDGCMSTNDMATVMANGFAGNKEIETTGKDFKKFTEALSFVCLDLAKKIVLDGEGATKFIEIIVEGAKNFKMAKQAAMQVANSPLVKTAAYGNNPNWGRVAAAIGSLGFPVTEKNLKIKFSPFDKKEIKIMANLNLGKAKATVYTCDLSHDYVDINGAYN